MYLLKVVEDEKTAEVSNNSLEHVPLQCFSSVRTVCSICVGFLCSSFAVKRYCRRSESIVTCNAVQIALA